jgi:hypothetical protein
MYYTDSSITEVQQATTGATFCRGLAITRISDDSFQNVPMVVNCYVEDVDPLGSGAHADAWQHGGGNAENRLDDNVIVYGLTATGLKYQSIFIRADVNSPASAAQGMAFVNVYMEMTADSDGWAGWGRWVDHLLWWHCTFAVKGMGLMSDTYAGAKLPCRITDFSVQGCDFAFFGAGDAQVDYAGWDHNHFVDPSFTAGGNVTTGDHLLNGASRPQAGSPLLDRLTPIVPADAAGRLRSGAADVGSFEG